MATKATNTILTGGDVRIFIQDGIRNPSKPYQYYGCITLGGVNKDLGTPDPIYCPSSTQRGKWDIVGRVRKTESLGTSDFTARMNRTLRDVWWELAESGCEMNIQAVIGPCQRPDNFNAWESKILLDDAMLTAFNLGAMNPLTGDDNQPIDLTGSFTFTNLYRILPINFSEQAASTIVAEVLDGFYNDFVQCGDCGAPSDGCQKMYWLTAANPGSPGLSSQIVYTLNGGSTWTTRDIVTLGGLSGNRVAPVGLYIVVISQANNAHHFMRFSDLDAGTGAWTRIASGYVSARGPRAIYSKSPNETFIAAAGGYVYKMTDPASAVTVITDGSVTAQNLNDIHGYDETVVAVGANNAVLVSQNAGATFSLVVGPVVGANLTAVYCLSDSVWFVGANGQLWYTLNRGTTWTQIQFVSGATVINDIQFFGNNVGYLAAEVGGVGRVYRTTDGGYSWHYQSPSIANLPTNLRINAIAPCGNNVVTAGGIVSVGGDGILATAK